MAVDKGEYNIAESVEPKVRVGSTLALALDENTANVVEADAITPDAKAVALFITAACPFSIKSKSISPLGKNRVHHNAIRRPLSTIRCFKMNKTTRKKKIVAERRRRRSSQSDFSRAVMSCLDVPMMVVSVSCVEDVDLRLAVEASRECVRLAVRR